MALRPTERQLRYALHLLAKNGYRTDWFSSQHKALGLTMRERSGRVSDMSWETCDKIIRALKDS